MHGCPRNLAAHLCLVACHWRSSPQHCNMWQFDRHPDLGSSEGSLGPEDHLGSACLCYWAFGFADAVLGRWYNFVMLSSGRLGSGLEIAGTAELSDSVD